MENHTLLVDKLYPNTENLNDTDEFTLKILICFTYYNITLNLSEERINRLKL